MAFTGPNFQETHIKIPHASERMCTAHFLAENSFRPSRTYVKTNDYFKCSDLFYVYLLPVTVQWNLSILELCGWQNYIPYNEIVPHKCIKNFIMWVTKKQKSIKQRTRSCSLIIKSITSLCEAHCSNYNKFLENFTTVHHTGWHILLGHYKPL
jgi:hypothetical protein